MDTNNFNSIPEVYGEDIRIYNHCTNCKEKLHIKMLCDLFNDMAELHTKIEGVDVATLNKSGLTWMLRRIHVCIKEMPKKEEVVRINTWCSEIKGLFVGRDYNVVYTSANGEKDIRVRAHSEWMLININKRYPERPTPFMMSEAERCTQEKWKQVSLFTKKEAKDMGDMSRWMWEPTRRFKANFDDIDFNGHVTQSSYIQWMMNALSFDFMKGHSMTELDVIYEREVSPDEEVEVLCAVEDSASNEEIHILHIVKSCGDKIHCKARSIWKNM